ncbi:hypothetical protein [Noviherbaspirillum suwonense]|uniref:Secreted protein n=1 Tax=Noviherbaspirillum suwonense TaxID=1224511 RepID=A0ABY1QWA8_9BURK|nr:hypothetical protein [Noviherbaspirillum suwonense]SMP82278.1 hypothetical protein SAMN06295970_1572 [Noviherbaspirillum suwonense]
MDWSTVVTSVISSLLGAAAISAGIAFLVKHFITRSIDIKFEQFKERQRLELQEMARRKAAAFDKQAGVYAKFVSVVFALRHTVREVTTAEGSLSIEAMAKFEVERRNFWSFVTENRAFLPDHMLSALHEFTQIETSFQLYAELIAHGDTQEMRGEALRKIRFEGERLDASYLELLREVQAYIGLSAAQHDV